MTSSVDTAATATVPVVARRPRRRFAGLVIGCLAGVIAVIGAGVPSYWGDEAASVLSAGRSLPSLLQLLTHVDAVHGVYYLFLHFWMGLVGTSEAAVRFPSAVAIGLAAAGTVSLGRRLFGMRLGVIAGILFAILPQVTRMGMEARSYAFAMAAAVWLTVWFVSLVRRGERRRRVWVLYGVATAASVYLFLYLALLLVVHAVALIAFRVDRSIIRRWLQATVIALVCAAPILFAALAQRGQIKFLAHRDYATAVSVFVGQWFSTPAFAIVAWLLLAIGIGTSFSRTRRRDLPATVVVLVWFAAPTALLLAGNAWLSPMYNLRYLAFCTPAVAMLMALGVERITDLAHDPRWRRAAVAALLVALVAVAAPRYLAQRGPYGKDGGSDLRQTADVIASHAASGDAIIFDSAVKPSRKPRLAIDLYPKSFTGVADVALVRRYADRPTLWDRVAPTSSVSALIRNHTTVWVVESGSNLADVDAVRALGYRIDETFPVHRTTVYELSKE